MELVVYIYCCYLNYNKAQKAQENGFKWGLLTLLAIFLAVGIGSFFLLASFVSNDASFREMASNPQQDPKELMTFLQKKITLLHQLFILFCGFGGYLLLRYLLTKKIEKKEIQIDEQFKNEN